MTEPIESAAEIEFKQKAIRLLQALAQSPTYLTLEALTKVSGEGTITTATTLAHLQRTTVPWITCEGQKYAITSSGEKALAAMEKPGYLLPIEISSGEKTASARSWSSSVIPSQESRWHGGPTGK